MSKKRLLVIDDEPSVREFVRRVAESMGYKVTLATRANEFRQAYTSFRPTVILVDMVMPDIEGIELVQWLADHQCTARVIVMTGYNQIYAETAAKLGKARGLASVTTLTKPILFDDLQAALENTRDTSTRSPQTSTP